MCAQKVLARDRLAQCMQFASCGHKRRLLSLSTKAYVQHTTTPVAMGHCASIPKTQPTVTVLAIENTPPCDNTILVQPKGTSPRREGTPVSRLLTPTTSVENGKPGSIDITTTSVAITDAANAARNALERERKLAPFEAITLDNDTALKAALGLSRSFSQPSLDAVDQPTTGPDAIIPVKEGVASEEHVLAVAAKYGAVKCVTALLHAGSTVNLPGTNGVTPLHIAATEGHAVVCTLLIRHGGDVNAVTTGCAGLRVPHGQTAAHKAALAASLHKPGAADTLRALFTGGADGRLCDGIGNTPYDIFCMNWQPTPASGHHHHHTQSHTRTNSTGSASGSSSSGVPFTKSSSSMSLISPAPHPEPDESRYQAWLACFAVASDSIESVDGSQYAFLGQRSSQCESFPVSSMGSSPQTSPLAVSSNTHNVGSHGGTPHSPPLKTLRHHHPNFSATFPSPTSARFDAMSVGSGSGNSSGKCVLLSSATWTKLSADVRNLVSRARLEPIVGSPMSSNSNSPLHTLGGGSRVTQLTSLRTSGTNTGLAVNSPAMDYKQDLPQHNTCDDDDVHTVPHTSSSTTLTIASNTTSHASNDVLDVNSGVVMLKPSQSVTTLPPIAVGLSVTNSEGNMAKQGRRGGPPKKLGLKTLDTDAAGLIPPSTMRGGGGGRRMNFGENAEGNGHHKSSTTMVKPGGGGGFGSNRGDGDCDVEYLPPSRPTVMSAPTSSLYEVPPLPNEVQPLHPPPYFKPTLPQSCKLVVWDFDLTLLRIHSHSSRVKSDTVASRDMHRDFYDLPFFTALIGELLSAGIHVAVASFGHYDVIQAFMDNALPPTLPVVKPPTTVTTINVTRYGSESSLTGGGSSPSGQSTPELFPSGHASLNNHHRASPLVMGDGTVVKQLGLTGHSSSTNSIPSLQTSQAPAQHRSVTSLATPSLVLPLSDSRSDVMSAETTTTPTLTITTGSSKPPLPNSTKLKSSPTLSHKASIVPSKQVVFGRDNIITPALVGGVDGSSLRAGKVPMLEYLCNSVYGDIPKEQVLFFDDDPWNVDGCVYAGFVNSVHASLGFNRDVWSDAVKRFS